ncbi:MAG: ABC transporter permease [Candidatus Accumulibacter sp.]|nr:ABC transporter permease [Accumulibacter sp.]
MTGKRSPWRAALDLAAGHYLSALVILGFFLAWEFAVWFFGISEFMLPSPSSALSHLFFKQPDADYHWGINIQTTLYEFIIAFAVTSVLGIAIGILIVWSRHAGRVLMPAFVFINSLPIIAVAPILLLWMGYGTTTNILLAFLLSFFPVVINTISGLEAIEDDLLNLIRYLHASKFQIFVKIRIPNSLPYVFSGLKICATMSVVGAIVGEFIASEYGLGHIIVNSQYAMDTPPIFSSLILISLFGGGLYLLVSFLEWVCMPWTRVRERA